MLARCIFYTSSQTNLLLKKTTKFDFQKHCHEAMVRFLCMTIATMNNAATTRQLIHHTVSRDCGIFKEHLKLMFRDPCKRKRCTCGKEFLEFSIKANE